MRTLILLSIAIAFGAALFSQPLNFWWTQNQTDFKIEKLTHLPTDYQDTEESKYFETRQDLPTWRFVETKFKSGDDSFSFYQSSDNETMNKYLDALAQGSFYDQEKFNLGKTEAIVYYSREGTRRFIWRRDNKRYEIKTNDSNLSIGEIRKIDEGLKPIQVDFFKSLRGIADGLGEFLTSLTKKPV